MKTSKKPFPFRNYFDVSIFPDSPALETRTILRKLDRIVGFPEETALMMKNFEMELFCSKSRSRQKVTLSTLLSGCAYDLSGSSQSADLALFGRLVSHFYLVCEWIVQLIISQPGHNARRAMLTCVLRYCLLYNNHAG